MKSRKYIEPEDRCPHCSFDPTSLSDYCDKHRAVARSRGRKVGPPAHVVRDEKELVGGPKLRDPVRLPGPRKYPVGNIVEITKRGTQLKVQWPDKTETEHHRKELIYL